MFDPVPVFAALRPLLAAHADRLLVKVDTADHLYLDTRHIQDNRKPLFFGAVQVKNNHVSYHLFPVYVDPGLLVPLSPALRQRMQGKSCFNFSRVDVECFDELDMLTRAGFAAFEARGHV